MSDACALAIVCAFIVGCLLWAAASARSQAPAVQPRLAPELRETRVDPHAQLRADEAEYIERRTSGRKSSGPS
jgi:hypothetical protein